MFRRCVVVSSSSSKKTSTSTDTRFFLTAFRNARLATRGVARVRATSTTRGFGVFSGLTLCAASAFKTRGVAARRAETKAVSETNAPSPCVSVATGASIQVAAFGAKSSSASNTADWHPSGAPVSRETGTSSVEETEASGTATSVRHDDVSSSSSSSSSSPGTKIPRRARASTRAAARSASRLAARSSAASAIASATPNPTGARSRALGMLRARLAAAERASARARANATRVRRESACVSEKHSSETRPTDAPPLSFQRGRTSRRNRRRAFAGMGASEKHIETIEVREPTPVTTSGLSRNDTVVADANAARRRRAARETSSSRATWKLVFFLSALSSSSLSLSPLSASYTSTRSTFPPRVRMSGGALCEGTNATPSSKTRHSPRATPSRGHASSRSASATTREPSVPGPRSFRASSPGIVGRAL